MRLNAARFIRWLALAAAVTLSTGASVRPLQIVTLGDSNTAGFLVGRRNAFPALMEASLRSAGYDVKVSNRGISGDTTGGMLSRVDTAVRPGVSLAIVQGGYNDQRRGVSAQMTAANIDAILARLSARKVKVVLCGFAGAQWAGIARRHKAVLVPADTCYDAGSRGIDGLHMNRAGHRIVAARLTPVIQGLLGRSSGKPL